jgi:hypothetical protein
VAQGVDPEFKSQYHKKKKKVERGRLVKGRNKGPGAFLGKARDFSRSPIPLISLLLWFFLVIVMAIVKCLGTGGCVI